jgi:cytochrome c oxidase assembly factor CtaG
VGVALVIAGGVELALAFWLARWWTSAARTQPHHHSMVHPPEAIGITSADGLLGGLAVLATALIAALGHRRVISRVAARDLAAACLTLALTLSPATCAIVSASHLAAMVQLELAAVVVPILLVRGFSSRARLRPGEQASVLSAAVLLVAVVGFPCGIVALHLPGAHDMISNSASMRAFLLAGIALCATAMWSVTLSPVVPYTTVVRLATLVWAVEIVSLIGLALILAGQPIYSHMDAPLDPLTDQRLAGGLMMLVELAVAVPAAKYIAVGNSTARPPMDLIDVTVRERRHRAPSGRSPGDDR